MKNVSNEVVMLSRTAEAIMFAVADVERVINTFSYGFYGSDAQDLLEVLNYKISERSKYNDSIDEMRIYTAVRDLFKANLDQRKRVNESREDKNRIAELEKQLEDKTRHLNHAQDQLDLVDHDLGQLIHRATDGPF